MKMIKKISIWILCFLLIPITYLIVSLVLTAVTVDREGNTENLNRSIYLSTNGVHLDIVIPFSTGFKAMFWKSSTLMHVTRYKRKRADWTEIKVNVSELRKLNTYIGNTFELDKNGMKTMLENKGYSSIDDFYKAKGSYSCFKTCNSWVNTGFKESGLTSCLWTPFDFGLLHKYE